MKNRLRQGSSYNAIEYYWRLRAQQSSQATPSEIYSFRKEQVTHRAALSILEDIIAGRFAYELEMIPPASPTDEDVTIRYDCLLTCNGHLPADQNDILLHASASLAKAFNMVSTRAGIGESGAPHTTTASIPSLAPQRDSSITRYTGPVILRFRDIYAPRELQHFAETHKEALKQALREHYKSGQRSTGLQ